MLDGVFNATVSGASATVRVSGGTSLFSFFAGNLACIAVDFLRNLYQRLELSWQGGEGGFKL